MFSRKVIIIALIIVGAMYFGFNYYSQPTDNDIVMENVKIVDNGPTEGGE
jgi:hypothetical protein